MVWSGGVTLYGMMPDGMEWWTGGVTLYGMMPDGMEW